MIEPNEVEKPQLIAAIDVGTNSFHMIIASVNSRGMLQIHSREREVVRLGSGSGDMKIIQEDAIQRGVDALTTFSKLAHNENAEIRAVATSAVREAVNREDFLDRVFEASGIAIEVISGVEEGRLIYLGALHSLPIVSQNTLIIDIGGGSTETIIGKGEEIKYVHSEKLGAIRVTQRFFADNKVTSKKIKECRDFIRGEWTPVMERILECGFETVVGTSGTLQNLAMMILAARGERIPEVLNGLIVTRDELLDIISRILAATPKQRETFPGLDPKRIDIIVGGALIIEHAIQALNIQKILISSYALREGILYDTVQKTKALKEYPHLSHLRYETVNNLCRQYHVDMTHAEHVKMLSIQMFNDLSLYHHLGNHEAEILEAAALLHDVGYHIAYDQHHKHSYYIILNSPMPGFTNDESELIANIARYHRKSHPKKKHENFAKLTPEKQKKVKLLSAILRIAEGLDRRQLQLIKSLRVINNKFKLKIVLFPDKDKLEPDIELWGAKRRILLLEETLEMPISIVVQ